MKTEKHGNLHWLLNVQVCLLKRSVKSCRLLAPIKTLIVRMIRIEKTVIRQKIVGARYLVYIKSSDTLLEEARSALMDPYWSLYLGESDDVVDVVFSRNC